MKTIKKYTREAFLAITSLGTTFFFVIIIVFLLTLGEVKIAKSLGLGLILCYVFAFLLRLFYFKERPEKEDYFNLFTKINASSFPSLHTMGSIYAAIVLANEIRKPLASIFLVFMALLIGYSRIYLKKHYFIDVVFGFILGIIAGVIYLFLINFS